MHLPSLFPLIFASSSLALSYKGVDWSSLLVEERAGKQYKNTAGTVQPLETILQSSGVNSVRQRIWVNPPNGDYNLDYNIKLAKRAKAAGLKIYLDFHYSDNWADPGKQATPSAWQSLSKDALVKQVYDYTKNTLNTFSSNGLHLDMVSIGNEITPGLLFPVGKLGSGEGAANVAALLKSASQAIKESSMRPTPKIMLHLDNGWNWDTQQWWYDAVLKGGLSAGDYDVQGVSYYPFYNTAATLASLAASLANMANKYGKDVMVVETDWPSYCPSPAYEFPSDTKSIPISVGGQVQWMKEVAKRLAGVSAGRGTGLFSWEIAWISNPWLGSSCGWNLMFDDDGKAMSSLAVFGQI